ncbi:hypothetical protein V8C86DRAFT_2431716 [Haematococcus lacustris]
MFSRDVEAKAIHLAFDGCTTKRHGKAVSEDRRGASDNWTLHQTRRVMWEQLAAGAGAPPGMLTPPPEQQGATAELYTSLTRKRGAGGRGGLGAGIHTLCFWATSVAAVSRGEARMSKTCMDLNVKI